MSHQNPAAQASGTPARRTAGAWAVVALLLGIGIVVPLLVFLYDSETPALFGFPFFYWFQFAMIPVVSLMTYAAFQISLWATQKDRPTYGLPPEPDAGADRKDEHR